jgi:hypothetical protein
LLAELHEGRLRQGWGYHPSQDLRLIQKEIAAGEKWWERLTETQKEAVPHLRMLSSAADSIVSGDLVLVPNLPEPGYLIVAEVDGEYTYDPLALSDKQDINHLGADYGHVLPVRLIAENGVNKYSQCVDARIRASLRTPMRMWNLNPYGDQVERLVAQFKEGNADCFTARSGVERLNAAWELARDHAVDQFRERLGPALDARFQAAEWEEPIKLVLGRLYRGAAIRWVAGAQEHGADVIVQLPNHFGGPPWLIVVQVKNYTQEIRAEVLGQLRRAHDRYSKEGKLLVLAVMTTAEKASADLTKGALALEDELKVPVKVVLRKETLKVLSQGLMGLNVSPSDWASKEADSSV